MLTPDKIKSQSFNLIDGQAYSKSEVDAFLEEVSRSYAQMFQENGELLRKISILATRIEEYRREEDIIKISLAAAQRSAEKLMADARASISTTLDQARREASLIKIDAQNRAKEIIKSRRKREREAQPGRGNKQLLNAAADKAKEIEAHPCFNKEKESSSFKTAQRLRKLGLKP